MTISDLLDTPEWEDYNKILMELIEFEFKRCISAKTEQEWRDAQSKLNAYQKILSIPVKKYVDTPKAVNAAAKNDELWKKVIKKIITWWKTK